MATPFIALSSVAADEELDIIATALQSYYDYTNGCVQFVPRTNENDYVSFKSSGLYSVPNGCSIYCRVRRN